MPRGLQFGRRIRVTVGNIIVADIDPAKPELSAGRSLSVSFQTEGHTKLEPLRTTVTVLGLNREVRARTLAQQKQAASVAWEEYVQAQQGAFLIEPDAALQIQSQLTFQGLQVRIEAGYQDDFGLIADATCINNGIKHRFEGAGWMSSFTAQDGRYPWQNSFVSEPVAPGVTMRDLDLVNRLSQGYLEGTIGADVIQEKVPELLVRKNFAGYANGGVLAGQGRDITKEIAEALGYTPFFDRGQLVYLDLDAVTADEAVILREQGPPTVSTVPTPGGLLTYEEQSRGFVTATCLLNYRLNPGRQVFLRDQDDRPIGEGVFRVDKVTHAGSSHEQTYNSTVLLRPTSQTRAENV